MSFAINFPKTARSFSVFQENFIPPGESQERVNSSLNKLSKFQVRVLSAFGFLTSPLEIATQLIYRSVRVVFSTLNLVFEGLAFVGAAMMGRDRSLALKKATFCFLDRTLDLVTSPVTLVAANIRRLVAVFDPEVAFGRPIG